MTEHYGGKRILRLLILYRWLSLAPPLVFMFFSLPRVPELSYWLLALLVAAALNGAITLFSRQLNENLRSHPWLLFIDIFLVSSLLAVTGGFNSPYYLYALNPLLAAAFFFRLRGSVIATTVFLPLLVASSLLDVAIYQGTIDWLGIVAVSVGAYLLSGTFGYASTLFSELGDARDELSAAHRELNVIYDLTLSLQSAADVDEVQEKVLEAVTSEFGFNKAAIGLVDQEKNVITSWLGRGRSGETLPTGSLSHPTQIPLSEEGGLVATALLEGRVCGVGDNPGSMDKWIQTYFGSRDLRVFPMTLRDHLIGALLVDVPQENGLETRLSSLELIAGQAAVAIGTTMMCIDRAQRLAVHEERIRIARDIHDTVSQSLFGIVFTLDGCLKLLPQQPEAVIPELERAYDTAVETRAEVRQSILDIWPTEITAEQFVADLHRYVLRVCQADNLQLGIEVRGGFSRLTSQQRRNLYRVAQEGLVNVARHSEATEAQVTLEIALNETRLIIFDNGRGFDPSLALAREYDREHFGLKGIQERAHYLDGICEITSQPGTGTTIVVTIPLSSPTPVENTASFLGGTQAG